jgi:hypothetical protein
MNVDVLEGKIIFPIQIFLFFIKEKNIEDK